MEKELVSIIVPVYNVEAYLERCVQSILKQTYEKIEVLLIDDGSKDSSGELCDAFARQDKRITVLHQKNAGQAAARNKGLEAATGQWICFVDSDDYIKEDFVRYLLEMVLENKVKMGFCKVCHKGFPDRIEEVEETDKIICYEGKTAVKYILEGRSGFTASMCRGICHKTLFENIRFMEGRLFEDLEILIRLGVMVDECVTGNKRNYCYCYRADNSSSAPIRKKVEDFIAVMDSIYRIVGEENDWLLESAYARDMMNCLFILAEKKETYRDCKVEQRVLRRRILAMPKGYEQQSSLYKLYYRSLQLGLVPFGIAYRVLNYIRALVIKIGL